MASTISLNKHISCTFELAESAYRAGETLSGDVVLEFHSETTTSDVSASLVGQLSTAKASEKNKNEATLQTEQLCKLSLGLNFGVSANGLQIFLHPNQEFKFETGRYKFPVKCQLPADLPSSVRGAPVCTVGSKGTAGRTAKFDLSYFAEVTIKAKQLLGSWEKTARLELPLVGSRPPADEVRLADLRQPRQFKNEREVKGWFLFGGSGKVLSTVEMNRQLFAAGESIQLAVEVDNQSKQVVSSIKAVLAARADYIPPGETQPRREQLQEVVSYEAGCVEPKATKKLELRLELPANMPPTVTADQCARIQRFYDLQVGAVVQGHPFVLAKADIWIT